MKIILAIFLLICCLTSSFAQITVDSILVYQTPATDSTSCFVDSVNISGTHTGQVLKKVFVRSPLLDAFATTIIVVTFEGCDSMATTNYDTTVTVDASTERFVLFSNWDTTTNCSYPTELTPTDTLLWHGCFPSNTNNLTKENQVKIYPNPASEVLKIEYSEGIRPRRIQLISLNGKIVKTFEPFEEILDVQTLTTGLYIIRIEMENGQYIRKRVIIQ